MGGLLVIAIIVMVVMLASRKPTPYYVPSGSAILASGPTGASGPAVAGAPGTSGEKIAMAAPTKGLAEPPTNTGGAAATPVADKKPEKPEKAKPEKAEPRARPDKPKKGAGEAPAAAPKPPKAAPDKEDKPEPRPAPKAGGRNDDLDCLLDPSKPGCKGGRKAARGGGGGGGGGEAAAPKAAGGEAGGGDVKDRLEPADIQKGMRAVKGRVQGCYDQYKVPGMVQVSVSISPNGRVASANVTGKFAGTPTGACVAGAVKGAKFDRFRGAALTITYPFVLR
jgi:hypothetical protein